MITDAAIRIVARVPHLTRDQLQAVFLAAVRCLDEEATEEIGLADDYTGPAVTSLNTLADALGVPGITPADDDDECYFDLPQRS